MEVFGQNSLVVGHRSPWRAACGGSCLAPFLDTHRGSSELSHRRVLGLRPEFRKSGGTTRNYAKPSGLGSTEDTR